MCCFVAGALRGIHAEALLPPPLGPTQWRSREDGRGGGGRLRKGGLKCTASDVSRVSLCVRVPRMLSDTAETHRADALVHGVRVYCTRYGAVRESSHIFCVPLCVFCGWGAARDPRKKHCCLRTLRGGSPQPPHQSLGPTSWVPVQRESRTIRPISLAFLEAHRQWVVNPPAQLPWIARRQTIYGPRAGVSTPHKTPALLASRPPLADLKACPIKRRRCQRVDHRW